MIYPSRVAEGRPRGLSMPNSRNSSRLVFPGKEMDWSYVGKRQFADQKIDRIQF
jgi:hypothetical protein